MPFVYETVPSDFSNPTNASVTAPVTAAIVVSEKTNETKCELELAPPTPPVPEPAPPVDICFHVFGACCNDDIASLRRLLSSFGADSVLKTHSNLGAHSGLHFATY
jgi:hypothetical protein